MLVQPKPDEQTLAGHSLADFQYAINQIPHTVRNQQHNRDWRWELPPSLRRHPWDYLTFTDDLDEFDDPDHYEYEPDLYDEYGNLIRVGRAKWAHKWGPAVRPPRGPVFFGGDYRYHGGGKGGFGGGFGGSGGGIFGKRETLPQKEGTDGQPKVDEVAVE
ncbi:hypothetical protein TWF281_000249 [Arthrobotrys megalospora]